MLRIPTMLAMLAVAASIGLSRGAKYWKLVDEPHVEPLTRFEPRRQDTPYIACDVCREAATQLYRQVASRRKLAKLGGHPEMIDIEYITR